MIEDDPAKSEGRPPAFEGGLQVEPNGSAVTVDQVLAVPTTNTLIMPQSVMSLQGDILKDDAQRKAFVKTISRARFDVYLKYNNNDVEKAINLYHVNAKLSQSFYLPLQIWEITLRNRLNDFLCMKYCKTWPRDMGLYRNLSAYGGRSIDKAIERLEDKFPRSVHTTDSIVAELSAGFWVSLFTTKLNIHLQWKKNLNRVFVADSTITREEALQICNDLLGLRNRIAHHEPIYKLPLSKLFENLERIVGALCTQQAAYLLFVSTVKDDLQAIESCLH